MSQCFFKPCERSSENVKVELYISNESATKALKIYWGTSPYIIILKETCFKSTNFLKK